MGPELLCPGMEHGVLRILRQSRSRGCRVQGGSRLAHGESLRSLRQSELSPRGNHRQGILALFAVQAGQLLFENLSARGLESTQTVMCRNLYVQ